MLVLQYCGVLVLHFCAVCTVVLQYCAGCTVVLQYCSVCYSTVVVVLQYGRGRVTVEVLLVLQYCTGCYSSGTVWLW